MEIIKDVLPSVTNHHTDHASCQFFVIMLTGKKLTLSMPFGNIVQDVKQQVFIKEGIPPNQQRLYFSGKQLEDGDTLYQCNIIKGSSIHLVLRLRGGMHHITSARYLPTDILAQIRINLVSAIFNDIQEEIFVSVKPTETVNNLINTFKENKLIGDDYVIIPQTITLDTIINVSPKAFTIKTNDITKLMYCKDGTTTMKCNINLNITVQEFLSKIYCENRKATITIINAVITLDNKNTLKEYGINDTTIIFIK
jgi:hypothetical protein